METKNKIKEDLEFFAEYFAYAMFANMDNTQLIKKLRVSDISGFAVYLFFNEYEPEVVGEDPLIELNCRITIKKKPGNKNGSDDVTVMYTQEEYFKAIINQIYKSNGAFQYYEFEFGVPNELKLYDAEFLIEEKLGIDLDEE